MKFLTRIPFNGKNLLGQPVSIPAGEYVFSDDRYILYNGLPICAPRSRIARTYFIWADDGQENNRAAYIGIILFNERTRIYKSRTPIYDEDGNIVSYREGYAATRFSPEEVEYLTKNFSHLIKPGDGFLFNDLFYIGSDIKDLQKMASYLLR